MKLSREQKEVICGKLGSLLDKHRVCPSCGTAGKWEAGTVLEMRDFNEGVQLIGAALTPLVPVMCQQCFAYTFHNAIRTGVVCADTGKILL